MAGSKALELPAVPSLVGELFVAKLQGETVEMVETVRLASAGQVETAASTVPDLWDVFG